MAAVLIEKSRTVLSDTAFFEVPLWHLPAPVPGSLHPFKYRLALVVNGVCVMRYDNERGKGDHRHIGSQEHAFAFTTLEALFDAFKADMGRIFGMTTLSVGIGSIADAKIRFLKAATDALDGKAPAAVPAIYFASYEDMHRVLAPARLAIVKAMAGQGPLAIREVARRVGRDVKAVHRDVTTLIEAGIVDQSADGVTFPYDRIRFAFDVSAAA